MCYAFGLPHSTEELWVIHRLKRNNDERARRHPGYPIRWKSSTVLQIPAFVQLVRFRHSPSACLDGNDHRDSQWLQRGPLPEGIFPEPVPELVPVPAPRCWELSQSFWAADSAVLSAVPGLMCAQSFGRGIVALGRSGVVLSFFIPDSGEAAGAGTIVDTASTHTQHAT